MNNQYYDPGGPAQRFILERLDLLVARLEQLGQQVRDTVARIVGTTVAEAVSEFIRIMTRFLPRRRVPRPTVYPGWPDNNSVDPYAEDTDPYGAQGAYAPEIPVKSPTSSCWRSILADLAARLVRWSAWLMCYVRPRHAMVLAGTASALWLTSRTGATTPDQSHNTPTAADSV